MLRLLSDFVCRPGRLTISRADRAKIISKVRLWVSLLFQLNRVGTMMIIFKYGLEQGQGVP